MPVEPWLQETAQPPPTPVSVPLAVPTATTGAGPAPVSGSRVYSTLTSRATPSTPQPSTLSTFDRPFGVVSLPSTPVSSAQASHPASGRAAGSTLTVAGLPSLPTAPAAVVRAMAHGSLVDRAPRVASTAMARSELTGRYTEQRPDSVP